MPEENHRESSGGVIRFGGYELDPRRGMLSRWGNSAEDSAATLAGSPGVFRISVTGGDAERIADLKRVHYTGYYSVWFELDPTDAPLLLRNVGTSDIYALTLEQK